MYRTINFDLLYLPKKITFLCSNDDIGIRISKSVEYIPINRLKFLHDIRSHISDYVDQEMLKGRNRYL